MSQSTVISGELSKAASSSVDTTSGIKDPKLRCSKIAATIREPWRRDMYSWLEGHSAEQADAVWAYVHSGQAESKCEAWVQLSKYVWPEGLTLDYIPGHFCNVKLAL